MTTYFEKQLKEFEHSIHSMNMEIFERWVSEGVDTLKKGHKIIASGLGKNVPVCEKFVGTMQSMGLDAYFLNTNYAVHGDLGVVKDGDMVVIKNDNLFTETKEYQCVITLEKEGVEIERRSGRMEADPLSENRMPLPFELPTDDDEYVLTVSFQLKEDTLWAKAGHEVAYGQTVIGHRKKKEHAKRPMTVTRGWCNTGGRGDDFEVLFSNLPYMQFQYVEVH